MGKIEIIELIKDQIKELDTYKTLSSEDLNSSSEFSNLIYEINQSTLTHSLKNTMRSKLHILIIIYLKLILLFNKLKMILKTPSS